MEDVCRVVVGCKAPAVASSVLSTRLDRSDAPSNTPTRRTGSSQSCWMFFVLLGAAAHNIRNWNAALFGMLDQFVRTCPAFIFRRLRTDACIPSGGQDNSIFPDIRARRSTRIAADIFGMSYQRQQLLPVG